MARKLRQTLSANAVDDIWGELGACFLQWFLLHFSGILYAFNTVEHARKDAL